jgi:hypothetical protein
LGRARIWSAARSARAALICPRAVKRSTRTLGSTGSDRLRGARCASRAGSPGTASTRVVAARLRSARVLGNLRGNTPGEQVAARAHVRGGMAGDEVLDHRRGPRRWQETSGPDDRRIVAFAVGTRGKDVQQGVDTRRILQLAQQGQQPGRGTACLSPPWRPAGLSWPRAQHVAGEFVRLTPQG